MVKEDPMRRLIAVVPALLLGASVAGAQPVGGAAARQALLGVDREWAAAAATRDVDRMVDFWHPAAPQAPSK
jgi:hypothetical protein